MNKYVKVKEIGQGSFGKALLVRSKVNGTQLVVKEINMNRMKSKEREEARKEVSVLAQLNHPNIVCYKDSFEEIGNLYIVMDYCDAGDLYSKINQQRGILFSEDQILDWFVQTCLAIKHIHDRKILHRDIKSQNIFLTRHGIVKLGDFGIAKVLNSTVELARTCIGTPYYLSPEICESKPYNNKSDIWSLGCVLYELTTLKHAFEAGNMKNLVVKIVRGSYPPPSPRFTFDLRSLISQLFKRNPRDRPSINSVLKKPLLQTRIRKFLSDSELQEEFSHTVMHGVKINKNVAPGAARPLPPKPQLAVRAPSPSQQQKYDPAAAYGPSVARKSASKENRKSAEVRKSSSGKSRKAPPPTPVGNHLVEFHKRRQELLEKERKRREEARKKELQAQKEIYAKHHQILVEKQKMSRINKAREEGWRGVMGSFGSQDDVRTPRRDDPPKIDKPAPAKSATKDRGNYDDYHAYLDKLQQERQNKTPAQANVPSGAGGAQGGAAQAAKYGVVAGARGAHAAEKARLVGEFMDRKNQAAINKARAHGDLFGGVAGAVSPRPAPKPTPTPSAGRPSSARDSQDSQVSTPSVSPSGGDRNEQEYLAKLRQIRLQNFNERRNIKDKQGHGVNPVYKPPEDPRYDPESRRKKIEALKLQADERARKLRDELDKKRKEAYDHEQKRLKDQMNNLMHQYSENKGKVDVKAAAPVKPAAPINMTEAMRAIGVNKDEPVPSVPQMEKCDIRMTAAMEAIGAGPSSTPDDSKATVQKQKEAILKRLNQKPPIAGKPDKAEKPERPKWGDPVRPPVGERPKWNNRMAADLGGRSLEETGSQMEATSVGDVVVKHEDDGPAESSEPISARRQWGRRADTIINVLGQADLAGAGTITPDTSDNIHLSIANEGQQNSETDSEKGKAPAIGSTITIVKNTVGGTVVIRANEADQASTPDIVENPEKLPVSSLDVGVNDKSRSRSSSPRSKQGGVGSAGGVGSVGGAGSGPSLFDRVELDEEEGSKEGQGIIVEDLDEEITENAEESQMQVSMETVAADDVQLAGTAEENDDKRMFAEMRKSLEKKSQAESKKGAGLLLGLTTGHFDADIKLLRTCSEPDLGKLFRTVVAQKASSDDEDDDVNVQLYASHIGAILDDDDDGDDVHNGSEEDNDETIESKQDITTQDDEDGSGKEDDLELGDLADTETTGKAEFYQPDFNDIEDDDDDVNDDKEEDSSNDDDLENSDDEDLNTMRETMRNLLEMDDLKEGEDPLLTHDKKKGKKIDKKSKKGKKIKKEKSPDSESRSISIGMSKKSAADLLSIRETMKTLLLPECAVKKKAVLKTIEENGCGDAKPATSKQSGSVAGSLDVRESWQSDDDEDDDYFEEDDMFSRLEETRAKLEQELGCDSFMKAYKTVQAIHEDEDENMEEGIQLVSSILGHDKIHLYPSILQLVMADGVFTEDND